MITSEDIEDLMKKKKNNKKIVLLICVIVLILLFIYFQPRNLPSIKYLTTLITTWEDENNIMLKSIKNRIYTLNRIYNKIPRECVKDIEIVSEFESLLNKTYYKKPCGIDCEIEKNFEYIKIKRFVDGIEWKTSYNLSNLTSSVFLCFTKNAKEISEEKLSLEFNKEQAKKYIIDKIKLAKEINNCKELQQEVDKFIVLYSILKRLDGLKIGYMNITLENITEIQSANEILLVIKNEYKTIKEKMIKSMYSNVISNIEYVKKELVGNEFITEDVAKALNACNIKSNANYIFNMTITTIYKEMLEEYRANKNIIPQLLILSSVVQ